MIKRIRQFRFLLIPFCRETPRFVRAYLHSRQLRLLIPAAFAFVMSVVLLSVFAWVERPAYRETLRTRYTKLTEQALAKNAPAANVCLARLLTVSADPQMTSFQFASQLYKNSKHLDDLSPHLLPAAENNTKTLAPGLRRSLTMMQSLAPRQYDEAPCAPAQEFMANYWRSREPQTPFTKVLAMQHDAYESPFDKVPAIKLAKYVAKRNYHAYAIDILNRHREANPDVLMLLAASHSKKGDQKSASKFLTEAEALLRTDLAADTDDVEKRLTLSRCIAAQSRVLESMFLLVEGYSPEAPPRLVDQLIQRYTVWLTLISNDKAMLQLADIELALRFAPTADKNEKDAPKPESQLLILSTGESVSLPTAIVEFHNSLLDGTANFLKPLLLGTEKAVHEEYEDAIKLLKEANTMAPLHPVIANNLAWCLLKTTQSTVEDKQQDSEWKKSMNNAWSLSTLAVESCPEVISFRATRGIVAAETERWQIAADDLRHCQKTGAISVEARQLLARVEKRLRDVELPPAQ